LAEIQASLSKLFLMFLTYFTALVKQIIAKAVIETAIPDNSVIGNSINGNLSPIAYPTEQYMPLNSILIR
jgi:hypothetical protein